MTFVGKILIVLQVVLSICFMAFAGAVFSFHNSWRAENDKTKTSLQSTQGQLSQLETEYRGFQTKSAADLATATDTAERAQATAAGVQQQLDLRTQELETARTERDNQRALAQIAGEEAKSRREETLKLREVNAQLHATTDNLVGRINSLEEEIFSKNVNINEIAKKHEAMLGDFAMLQEILRKNKLDDNPETYAALGSPPPVVEGVVLSTRRGKPTDPELVEISLGGDDGLVKGHELFVYRTSDSKYLGKIRLELVRPDKSVGVVIDRAKNGIIEMGDNVSTKL